MMSYVHEFITYTLDFSDKFIHNVVAVTGCSILRRSILKKIINERIAYLQSVIDSSKKSLRYAPTGSLQVSVCRGKPQFYMYSKDEQKRKYLSDEKKITRLAQKEYDTKIIRAGEEEMNKLQRLYSSYPEVLVEDVIDTICTKKKPYVNPIILSDDEYARQWQSEEFSTKGVMSSSSEYVTDRGERVRSKSELTIANTLDKMGIPYKYECPLYLEGMGTIYPDFTILNVRTRKEYYHEHFGMMSDPEYSGKCVARILAYQQNGYFMGESLIATYEADGMNFSTTAFRQIVEKYYI